MHLILMAASRVRVVSKDYVRMLPAQLTKFEKSDVISGEGYTDAGLRFGPGWVERVAADSTGILDLRELRIPDLERSTQKALDTVSLIRSGLDQLSEALFRTTAKCNEKSTEVQELDKEFVQLSNRLVGLEAKDSEIETSRQRLNREKATLTQSQMKIGEEIQEPLSRQLVEASESQRVLREPIDDCISRWMGIKDRWLACMKNAWGGQFTCGSAG